MIHEIHALNFMQAICILEMTSPEWRNLSAGSAL